MITYKGMIVLAYLLGQTQLIFRVHILHIIQNTLQPFHGLSHSYIVTYALYIHIILTLSQYIHIILLGSRSFT